MSTPSLSKSKEEKDYISRCTNAHKATAKRMARKRPIGNRAHVVQLQEMGLDVKGFAHAAELARQPAIAGTLHSKAELDEEGHLMPAHKRRQLATRKAAMPPSQHAELDVSTDLRPWDRVKTVLKRARSIALTERGQTLRNSSPICQLATEPWRCGSEARLSDLVPDMDSAYLTAERAVLHVKRLDGEVLVIKPPPVETKEPLDPKLRPSATIKLDGEEHDPSNYICIEALGQGAFPPNTLSNFASGYDDVRKSSENAFHMRYRDQADRANPTALTTEFGGSAFPGGSEKQIESSQLKKPFLLNSTDPERNPEAAAFWNAHGPTIIKAMWEASARRYPELAKLQKEKLRGHGIFDTGFAKATVHARSSQPSLCTWLP